jgi:hypothetical protein
MGPPSPMEHMLSRLEAPVALHATHVELRQMGVTLGVSTAEQSLLCMHCTQDPVATLQNGVARLRSMHAFAGSAAQDTHWLLASQ